MGGKSPVDADDALALSAARAAVDFADRREASTTRHVLREILPSSTKQVVAGISYVFDLVADGTTCPPRHAAASILDEDCAVVPLAAVRIHAAVWAQPWRLQEPYRVSEVAVEPFDEASLPHSGA